MTRWVFLISSIFFSHSAFATWEEVISIEDTPSSQLGGRFYANGLKVLGDGSFVFVKLTAPTPDSNPTLRVFKLSRQGELKELTHIPNYSGFWEMTQVLVRGNLLMTFGSVKEPGSEVRKAFVSLSRDAGATWELLAIPGRAPSSYIVSAKIDPLDGLVYLANIETDSASSDSHLTILRLDSKLESREPGFLTELHRESRLSDTETVFSSGSVDVSKDGVTVGLRETTQKVDQTSSALTKYQVLTVKMVLKDNTVIECLKSSAMPIIAPRGFIFNPAEVCPRVLVEYRGSDTGPSGLAGVLEAGQGMPLQLRIFNDPHVEIPWVSTLSGFDQRFYFTGWARGTSPRKLVTASTDLLGKDLRLEDVQENAVGTSLVVDPEANEIYSGVLSFKDGNRMFTIRKKSF